jgi:hypothetical protein
VVQLDVLDVQLVSTRLALDKVVVPLAQQGITNPPRPRLLVQYVQSVCIPRVGLPLALIVQLAVVLKREVVLKTCVITPLLCQHHPHHFYLLRASQV